MLYAAAVAWTKEQVAEFAEMRTYVNFQSMIVRISKNRPLTFFQKNTIRGRKG